MYRKMEEEIENLNEQVAEQAEKAREHGCCSAILG